MKVNHIIAVFKAEYYTTTSKFRSFRNYIPVLFLIGVIAFSYILRVIYELFRGDTIFSNPPITSFFSIIAVFSYFILFTPLLSPLGRLVYDGSAKSRREVALNSPVAPKDLLYGNLLSNLAFFLPFFGFIGTLTLSPFIGNGIYSPLVTSLALFAVLSLLILVGLVGGTLISPLIFAFISTRKNSQTRAVVSFSVSAMLILSLPIFRYFLENTTIEGNLGWITYLPFTLAGILIVYILYGISIGLPILQAIIFLSLYIIGLIIIGYFSADTIYNLDTDENDLASAHPDGRPEKILRLLTSPIPPSYRNVVKATMVASLRDIEHLARLTIGLSITVFMIFALSSRGLFRQTANFDERIELAVIIFALVLSSASIIMIEASSFTIHHKDMFALIKSAPKGAQKFVFGKAIQMVILLVPIFISIIIGLSALNFISFSNLLPLSLTIILILITMTTLSLAIYLLNPSDNEEDLGNFLNLLIFYVISFAIAVGPVYIAIIGIRLQPIFLLLAFSIVISLSILFLYIASEALEKLNLETLDSTFSRSILQGVKTIGLFFLGWNLLPLLGIGYLLETQDILGFLILNYLIILLVVMVYYYWTRSTHSIPKLNVNKIITSISYLGVMLLVGASISYFSTPSLEIQTVLSLEINLFTVLSIIGIISILAATEELFFRGMLLEYAERNMSLKGAATINTLIFGFIHIFPLSSLINAIIQSFILIKIKKSTKSIFYPVIVHICYNLILIGSLFLLN